MDGMTCLLPIGYAEWSPPSPPPPLTELHSPALLDHETLAVERMSCDRVSGAGPACEATEIAVYRLIADGCVHGPEHGVPTR
jgi:hypothetical protein